MFSLNSKLLVSLVPLLLSLNPVTAVPARRHPRYSHQRRGLEFEEVRDAVADFSVVQPSSVSTTTAFYALAQVTQTPEEATEEPAGAKVLAVQEEEQGHWQVFTTSTWIGASSRAPPGCVLM
jgi:hypothetical protein